MPENPLAQNVGQFLDRCIHSVSQLEVLLLLHKHQLRSWTAHEIANELHTNDAASIEMLEKLAAHKLIARSTKGTRSEYRYESSAGLDEDLVALSRAYKEIRIRVIDRIYKKPSSAAIFQSIADSFLLRKSEPE